MLPRIDRVLTLSLFATVCHTAQPRTIPILMYHSISEQPSKRNGYYKTNTPPKTFAAHLSVLRALGYQSITLSEVPSALAGRCPAGKPIALTFDDGFADFFEHAYPMLCEYGHTATMFLPTASIGDERKTFRGRTCLTWDEVRTISRAGIEFGSHTVSHPQLHDLPEAAIRAELSDSRTMIEDRLGVGISSFSYPFAVPQTDAPFIKTVRRLLVESGYRQGVCTKVGRCHSGSDLLMLERIPVNGEDDLRFFQAKLAGAYDWVGWAQTLAKRAIRPRRLPAYEAP